MMKLKKFIKILIKKNSNKKKEQGIWFIERRPSKKSVVPGILKKKWGEVDSMDLYYLYTFNWTTQAICETFQVEPRAVINKLRRVTSRGGANVTA